MKKILLMTLVLAIAITGYAQNEKRGMNSLAEEYINKEEGTLIFEQPKRIVVERDSVGYSINVEGEYNGYNYKIKLAHSIEPLQYITVQSNGIITEDDIRIIFEDANLLTLSKNENYKSAEIIKKGENGYTYRITLEGKSKESKTIYKEYSADWNFNIPFKEKEKTPDYYSYAKFNLDLLSDLEFGMGLVSAHSQAPGMDVEFGNAGWEFILNNIIKFEYRPFKTTSLSLGFGVDWRNYRMKGDRRFKKEGNNLIIATYPDNADIDFSRVKVFSMTLELLLRQKITKRVSLAVGPIVNFNTHASIKTKYEIGSGKSKEGFEETSNDINQKPVTVDFKGVVTIDPISFYFKYSPVNTLDTDYSPEFKSMSAGLMISF